MSPVVLPPVSVTRLSITWFAIARDSLIFFCVRRENSEIHIKPGELFWVKTQIQCTGTAALFNPIFWRPRALFDSSKNTLNVVPSALCFMALANFMKIAYKHVFKWWHVSEVWRRQCLRLKSQQRVFMCSVSVIAVDSSFLHSTIPPTSQTSRLIRLLMEFYDVLHLSPEHYMIINEWPCGKQKKRFIPYNIKHMQYFLLDCSLLDWTIMLEGIICCVHGVCVCLSTPSHTVHLLLLRRITLSQ